VFAYSRCAAGLPFGFLPEKYGFVIWLLQDLHRMLKIFGLGNPVEPSLPSILGSSF